MIRVCWWDRAVRSAPEQMALDLATTRWAAREQIEVLRWYQWQHDTLSLGMHEAALRTWRRDCLDRDRVQVVRRPTGGRGVWHAASDLTYAWSGPSTGAESARIRYRELHETMAATLRANGLAARVNDGTTGRADLSPGACFGLSVGGEILVGERKAVGAAQRLIQGGLLQHGAIARDDHHESVNRYLRDPAPPARSSQENWPSAGALAEALERDERLRGAVAASPELITALESASVEELATFVDPTWTWRR